MAESEQQSGISEKRVLLVLIALLCGVVAGLVAGFLAYNGHMRSAVLYGFGAFAAATLFILAIEGALRLFDLFLALS